MYQKNRSLPAHVWSSVTIIIHLFVLGDFIFEASHEECDVKKFSQRNGAAWILSGELSSLTSPRPTTSPTPPFHLIVPVECRLMNLKII